MKSHVLLTHVIEMPEAEAQEVIEALSLERSNPGFRKRVAPFAAMVAKLLELGLPVQGSMMSP